MNLDERTVETAALATAIHHPKLVPVLMAAIIVVVLAWLGTSLFGWHAVSRVTAWALVSVGG